MVSIEGGWQAANIERLTTMAAAMREQGEWRALSTRFQVASRASDSSRASRFAPSCRRRRASGQPPAACVAAGGGSPNEVPGSETARADWLSRCPRRQCRHWRGWRTPSRPIRASASFQPNGPFHLFWTCRRTPGRPLRGDLLCRCSLTEVTSRLIGRCHGLVQCHCVRAILSPRARDSRE